MATKKQKQELVDILKFTPITVSLRIQGYGGESYAGVVDKNTYNFFKKNKYDLEEYASDWDGEWEVRVPREVQPFSPGSPYDCDGLWHASGAELSDLNSLTIENTETNETIWEISPGYSQLVEAGVEVVESGGTELSDLDDGTIVFWGGQGEKGCFFDAEFTLRAPFDPSKLVIYYENCDDWYIISGVEYDGEEIDGSGGYSTTGKWGENKWVIVGDEEVYEAIPLDEREDEEPIDDEYTEDDYDNNNESTLTDWFEKDIKPTEKGEYDVLIDAPWPNGGPSRAEWSGRTWKKDGEKIAIHKWRGLAENPNE